MAKTTYKITEAGLLSFPKSLFDRFRHANKNLRWGQAFHQFMKLEKCQQDKNFCDRLYNEVDEEKAKAMVISRLDRSN